MTHSDTFVDQHDGHREGRGVQADLPTSAGADALPGASLGDPPRTATRVGRSTRARTSTSRTADGRSSIHRDAQGVWHGYVSMGQSNQDKAVRRHVRGKTRAVVSAKVQALEAERGRTAHRPASSQRATVGEWLDEWLVIVARTRKPKTYDNYAWMVGRHCGPLRDKPLARLSVRDIDDLLHEVGQRTPQSAASLRRILRSSFNTAIKRGVLVANPCTHSIVPRVREEELEPFDLQECHAILAAALGRPDAARWSVALALGLRQGETLGLQWKDVDLDAGEIRVRRQVQRLNWHHGCRQARPDHHPSRCAHRTGGGWTFEDVKSRAGRRILTIPAQLVDQLRTHRSQQAQERLAAGPVWQDHDLVFPRADGLPKHPTVDAKAWRHLLNQAGVRHLRLHYARHTTATMLLAQGVDGRVVMALLGWSQTSLLSRYQHVVDPLRREAAQRIAATYWPST